MDIQTIGTERKKVDSTGLTNVASMGVGAAFAYMLLKWLLHTQTKQQEILIELQRESVRKLDRVIELIENRGEL